MDHNKNSNKATTTAKQELSIADLQRVKGALMLEDDGLFDKKTDKCDEDPCGCTRTETKC